MNQVQSSPRSSRLGLRLALGLIALLCFGYLAEIFFLGAPDLKKNSDRVFDRLNDPGPFWIQFAAVAVAGGVSAYFCAAWKRTLSIVGSVEARDRATLERMPPKARAWEMRHRARGVWFLAVMLSLVLALWIFFFTSF